MFVQGVNNLSNTLSDFEQRYFDFMIIFEALLYVASFVNCFTYHSGFVFCGRCILKYLALHLGDYIHLCQVFSLAVHLSSSPIIKECVIYLKLNRGLKGEYLVSGCLTNLLYHLDEKHDCLTCH